jgi:hypothetical protein
MRLPHFMVIREPNRTAPMRLTFLLAFVALAVPAAAQSLGPFKDELFAYPPTLSTSDDGALVTVDYREMRDINGRDQIPERRVKKEYIALGVRGQQRDEMLRTDAGDVRFVAVGREEGASLIVLYLHGKGGSRRQGVDDYTFGGNFNRVKNLVAGAGGLYLSPDFSDFGAKGSAEVAALIGHYAASSPRAPVVVACGSMGGGVCYGLASDPAVAPRLAGLMLLGSHWDDGFASSLAFKRRVPVFFGQGSRDPVFPLERQVAFFRSLRAAGKNYPARFVVFAGGTHGTPIRMTDWRDAINWMLSRQP